MVCHRAHCDWRRRRAAAPPANLRTYAARAAYELQDVVLATRHVVARQRVAVSADAVPEAQTVVVDGKTAAVGGVFDLSLAGWRASSNYTLVNITSDAPLVGGSFALARRRRVGVRGRGGRG